MHIGASTANLYPMNTEDALDALLRLGFRELEVFVNTESEIAPSFLRQLKESIQAAGARVVSLHPYISGSEPYILYSAYERRYRDGLDIYARLFEAASYLGAGLVVMHGDKAEGVLPVEESIARFEGVSDLGRTYGVTLAQENVVRFRASDNAYIAAMRRQLGPKAAFVFDLKQCRRCGHRPEDVVAAMGSALVHVHISDNDARRDCPAPRQRRGGLRQLVPPAGLRRLRRPHRPGAVSHQFRAGIRAGRRQTSAGGCRFPRENAVNLRDSSTNSCNLSNPAA